MLKNLLPALLVLLALAPLQAKNPVPVTDLKTAQEQSSKENKLLLVVYGRPACGNCQALHQLIDDKKLKFDDDLFVFADILCDDKAQSPLFRSSYKVNGTTLPFVVIAAPDGSVLASRTGYGTEKEFDDLLKEARKAQKKKQEG
jgi:hypothetical protein